MKKLSVIFFIYLSINTKSFGQCWKDVKCGGAQSYALLNDGTMWAWGLNAVYQIGCGDTNNRNHPIKISTTSDWKIIAAGHHAGMAINQSNKLFGWGINKFGNIGTGFMDTLLLPTQIGIDSDWDTLSMGLYHTLALKSNGTLWAWGTNYYGELGDTTFPLSLTYYPNGILEPHQVGSDSDWAFVSAGYSFSFGIKTNGTLWAWGVNGHGQFGSGNYTQYNYKPIQIGIMSDWKAVATGGHHTLALKQNGTLWACGENLYGELGIGNQIETPIFTQVGNSSNWESIACGYSTSHAINSNGELYSWGNNINGTLGLGDTINRLIPTQVSSVNNWRIVSGGSAISAFINSENELFTSGVNNYGSVGDSTNINRDSLTQINLTDCLPSSIKELQNSKYKLITFPNPTFDRFEFYSINQKENYSIYNLLGVKLLEGTILRPFIININSFQNGIYILEVGELKARIIKQ